MPESYFTKDDLCVICVTQILFGGPNQATIKFRGEGSTEKWQLHNQNLYSQDLIKIQAALLWAFNAKQDVWLNGIPVWPGTMEWGGTKLCSHHLLEAYERYNSPQSVRMAQWRR